MKAFGAVLFQVNQPLLLKEFILPPLGPGQVMVRISFSGICHSQLMEVRGKRGTDRFLPHLLGHEATGTVVETGPGVTKVAPGDKVILGWIKGTGIDAPGAKAKMGDQEVNFGGVSTFSTYSIVSENRCVKMPPGIPMDVGVLFGCALPTGAGITFNQVKPEKDSTVAVVGLGGIGLSALLALKGFSCRNIIAIDIEAKKLALAKEFGATHQIQVDAEDVIESVKLITNGKGVDYCIEAGGLTSTIEMAFNITRKFGGLCVFASHPATGEKIALDPHDLISGKRIEGSWGGSCKPDEDTPRFATLYREKKLPLERLLSNKYRLEEINQALDDLEHRKVARALLEIHPE